MEIPAYYPVENDGPDLEARRAYLAKLADFAQWDGPTLDKQVEEAILNNCFDVDDDLGSSFLQFMREQAYAARLEYDICSILGDQAEGYDITDFAGVVADNWEGEPLESCASFVNDQCSAVWELFGAYKASRQTSTGAGTMLFGACKVLLAKADEDVRASKADEKDRIKATDDTDPATQGLAASLRSATTQLANTASAEEAAKIERQELRKIFHEEGVKLKERAYALVDQLNHIAAMLYNARFPDHALPEEYQIYVLHDLFTYPQFDYSRFHDGSGWYGNKDDLYASGRVRVDYDRLNKAHHWAGQSLILKPDVDFRPALVFRHDGTWSFCHRANRRYIDGGVTSVMAFFEAITRALKGLE